MMWGVERSDGKGWHGRTYALKRLRICESPRIRVLEPLSLFGSLFSVTLRTPDTSSSRQAVAPLVPSTFKNAHVCAHPALFSLNLRAFRRGVFFYVHACFFFAAFVSGGARTALGVCCSHYAMAADPLRRRSRRQRCLYPPIRLPFPCPHLCWDGLLQLLVMAWRKQLRGTEVLPKVEGTRPDRAERGTTTTPSYS